MGATEFVVPHIGCADCMRLTFCQAQKVSKKAGRGKPSPATVITCGRHAVNSLRSDSTAYAARFANSSDGLA
ncbi:MAG: hypothetical protein WCP79_14850 [Bacillota bacterium]